MLDYRHKTFYHLCNIKNYTKTAKALHMTQPAVTQHINYLESYYNCKLVNYEGKVLTLTEQGKQLFTTTAKMMVDSDHLKSTLTSLKSQQTITFGTTLTIGEYVMPKILSELIKTHQNTKFNMRVENTKSLLKKLDNGFITFALIEGYFDKTTYGYIPFSKEPFIAVCSKDSPFKKGLYTIDDLLTSPLIVREQGSGTRDIFEQQLSENGHKVSHFKHVIEIGNIQAIKTLIQKNHGISFIYEAAVLEELKHQQLFKIDIKNFTMEKQFNFVYIKDSIFKDQTIAWFDKISALKTF